MTTIIQCALGLAIVAFSSEAFANPRPLPFSYPYETLGQGEVEFELYGDMSPLRVAANPMDPARGRLWEPAYVLQNEIEYGVSERIEIGFYQVFQAQPLDGGSNAMTFDGFKWRLRARLGEAGQWPLDVGLYAELETLHDEMSLEEKVILAKRIGHWHWMANLWIEESEHRAFDSSQRSFHFIVNPTTGVTYEITPIFQPGIEYWARGEFGTVGTAPVDIENNRIHHFIGPTVHLNFGRLWWSTGLYIDLTNANNPQPGEMYGPCWARTVLGLSL